MPRNQSQEAVAPQEGRVLVDVTLSRSLAHGFAVD